MKRLGALALFALASWACVVWPAGSGPGAAPMPLAEALDLRDGGRAVLVDVRSSQAYARGHIPGALNIAADELEARAAELRKMSRLPILYCG